MGSSVGSAEEAWQMGGMVLEKLLFPENRRLNLLRELNENELIIYFQRNKRCPAFCFQKKIVPVYGKPPLLGRYGEHPV
jgi:hypothetical protein